MKQIPLTQDKIALVDDDIYELIKVYKWHTMKNYNIFYAARNTSRKDDPQNKQYHIYLHHLVVGKPPKGMDVDHIDGNGLNNQRSNLRVVLHRKNTQNLLKQRMGRLVGASWNKRDKKWRADIQINGKRVYLGYFDSEQEAHETYMKELEKINDK
jgi:hypothetical protein